jgi:hypothetical protein
MDILQKRKTDALGGGCASFASRSGRYKRNNASETENLRRDAHG